jgi:hypothetical protein
MFKTKVYIGDDLKENMFVLAFSLTTLFSRIISGMDDKCQNIINGFGESLDLKSPDNF